MTPFQAVITTHIVGWSGMLSWLVFTFQGAFGLVSLNLSDAEKLTLNLVLSLLFFTQHSLMVRPFFRHWLSRRVRECWHGSIYSISSGALLIVTTFLWQKTDWSVFEATGMMLWIMRIIFGAAVAGFYLTIRALDTFDIFGLEPLTKMTDYESPSKSQTDTLKPRIATLVVSGPYRFVRHPLYTCCLMMIWSCPDITGDRLLYNILWSIWIFVGATLEEKDLARSFGRSYLDYQSRVPMLAPINFRRMKASDRAQP